VSTYRDDLEAAQARADAAEGEAKRLRKEVERLKKPDPKVDVPEVPIPERFKVEHTANELVVSWRWWKAQFLFLLFFCIAWDGFLLFWYFGPVTGGGLLFKIFPIAHVAAGIALTYFTLTGFVNHTVIAVRQGTLTVRHGPLPWRGNRTLARDQVQQLFVTENETKSTDNDSSRVTITKSYDLCALLDSGREMTLLKRLDTAPQAQFLERTFEQHMGIEDRKIAGELAKST